MKSLKRNIIVCTLVFVGLLICVNIGALELDLDAEDETVVYVNGESKTRSYNTILRFLNKNRQVETLVLEDIPGSSDDDFNIKICRLIYERKLTTELVDDSIVESGGADLFACGYKLIAHPDAQIGVHSWSDDYGAGVDVPRDDPVHSIYLDLYNDVNIDEDFYWFTLQAASADEVHYMTAQEKEQYFGHKME